MKRSTASNHLQRWSEFVNDTFSQARHFALSHSEIIENLKNKVYSDPAWEKVPSWVRERISSKREHLFDQLYCAVIHGEDLKRVINGTFVPAFVRWQLRVDGEFVSCEEISRRRGDGDEDIWNRVEGAHVWNHKPNKSFGKWGKVKDTIR